MTNIYPMYAALARNEALSQQSLNTYFESNESYIGRVRSTRFRWQEVKEVPKGDIATGIDGEMITDNTMKRIMTFQNRFALVGLLVCWSLFKQRFHFKIAKLPLFLFQG